LTKRKLEHHETTEKKIIKKYEFVPDDFVFDIDKIQYISRGFSGKVFKCIYYDEIVALKICDVYDNPKGLDQILHKVDVYNQLQDLQGVIIPKLVFSGYDTGIFILATLFIEGHDEKLDITRVQNALNLLKEKGVEHGDSAPNNIIIRDSDDSVWIIDLGIATLENSKK
jgi:tRNA A-37 threonylcarbamoyl transferase component Bud32